MVAQFHPCLPQIKRIVSLRPQLVGNVWTVTVNFPAVLALEVKHDTIHEFHAHREAETVEKPGIVLRSV